MSEKINMQPNTINEHNQSVQETLAWAEEQTSLFLELEEPMPNREFDTTAAATAGKRRSPIIKEPSTAAEDQGHVAPTEQTIASIRRETREQRGLRGVAASRVALQAGIERGKAKRAERLANRG